MTNMIIRRVGDLNSRVKTAQANITLIQVSDHEMMIIMMIMIVMIMMIMILIMVNLMMMMKMTKKHSDMLFGEKCTNKCG